MLSKLELKSTFRSLNTETFDSDARFGRRTVIYGHNGSGKSSLAELLYQLSEGSCSEAVEWFDNEGKRVRATPNEKPSSVYLSVFTKSWIKKNVEAFLDGDTAPAIVTLGTEQVEAKDEERRLTEELEEVERKLPTVTELLTAREKASKAVVTGVQDGIEGSLGSFDRTKYTKQQFKAPKVEGLLQRPPTSTIGEEQYRENLSDLTRGPLDPLSYEPPKHPDWKKLSESIRALYARSVDSKFIEELRGDRALQTWLEQGLSLHTERDNCHFCKNPIPEERRKELRDHFDRSRKEVQEEAKEIQCSVEKIRSDYEAWQNQLPEPQNVYPELHERLEDSLVIENDLLSQVFEYLEKLSEVLIEKHNEPERTSFEPLPAPPTNPGEKVTGVADAHREILEDAEQRQSQKADEVVNYLVSSRAEEYQSLKSQKEVAAREKEELSQRTHSIKSAIQQARAKQTTSQEMAEQISRDLALVYGKSHLSIQVSEDSTGYVCHRQGQPARNLSDGERNTLALVYFLRHLQDQRERIDPKQRLVVVDDPSSSLDRESLYATHAWLLESLQDYGQTIILTHDFEMLRLLLNSQSGQVRESRKALKTDSRNAASVTKAEKERKYPKISFLELRSRQLDGEPRRSSLRRLSKRFIDHRTEYHYLFDRVLTGIEHPDDHGLLFLLPNAARRVIESFSSFHVPNEANFLAQLKKLAIEDKAGEYRDVYDFCNRFSHGEGREAQLLLDAHDIEKNIRRCMEFLRDIDSEHYNRMLKATDRLHDPLEHEVEA